MTLRRDEREDLKLAAKKPRRERDDGNDRSSEEVLAAFRDWRSQFSGATVNGRALFSEERIEAEIAAVREFARFLDPKLLAESTVREIDDFKRQIPRGSRAAVTGIELFRTFRAEVLKPRKTVRARDLRGN